MGVGAHPPLPLCPASAGAPGNLNVVANTGEFKQLRNLLHPYRDGWGDQHPGTTDRGPACVDYLFWSPNIKVPNPQSHRPSSIRPAEAVLAPPPVLHPRETRRYWAATRSNSVKYAPQGSQGTWFGPRVPGRYSGLWNPFTVGYPRSHPLAQSDAMWLRVWLGAQRDFHF